jgi:hypothetical protein
MKKSKFLFSFLGLVLVLGLVSGCTMAPKEEPELGAEEESELEENEVIAEPVIIETEDKSEEQEIAQNWVLNFSPTYVFSGKNLMIEGDPIRASGGTEFSFSFVSDYPGYGDLSAEEELVEQEVTHMIVVTVNEEGKVVRAVVDNIYDEIYNEML